MNREEKKIVPQLRFPEFKNDGDWKSTELGKYLLKHPEYGIGASAVPYSEKLPTYLRITDISVDGKFLKEDKVSVAEKVTKVNYLKEGDIVFARTGASVGKSYKYRVEDGELVFAGFLIRVKPNPSLLNSEILFQFTSTEQYWKWVKLVSARSGQPGINGKQYASMPILLPTNPKEQQKIAACLSSLDEVITAETEKLDLLQDHKKGLLQQLFPAEGETQPKFRFPEFIEDGDWITKPLGDLVEIKGRIGYRGYTKKDIVEKGKGAITLSPSNFDDNGKLVFEKSTYITWEKYYESPEIMLEEGQTVLVKTASVGKSAYVGELPEKATVNPQIVVLKPKKIEPKFLAYTIFHNYVQNQITKAVGAGAIPNMSQASIAQIEILLPKDKNQKEQQKIATCLSAADELIEAQAKKIEALQEHKKGLLQQLFP